MLSRRCAVRKATIEEQVKMGKLYGIWTIEAVSILFGVSPYTVRRWIKQGKLKALDVGNFYLITTDALRKFFEDEYHIIYQRRYNRRLKKYAGV